jgi:AraC-like DNA-binding protein
MHRHSEVEVNLVVDGTATYVMRERRYELSLGSIVWLFPKQDHLLLDQSPTYRMWIAVFKPELIRRLCTDEDTWPLRQADPVGHYCRRLAAAPTARLDMLFRDLLEATQHAARFNIGLAYVLLSSWAAYQEADDTGVGHDVHPAVERAARLLYETVEPLGLAGLARRVGLSPSHLCRLFKEQMGQSPAAFRNRQCVDRFLRLYGHGRRRTMMDAALDAGFGSYAQFYRVFVGLMGCTPAEYRRRRRGPGDDPGAMASLGDFAEAAIAVARPDDQAMAQRAGRPGVPVVSA